MAFCKNCYQWNVCCYQNHQTGAVVDVTILEKYLNLVTVFMLRSVVVLRTMAVRSEKRCQWDKQSSTRSIALICFCRFIQYLQPN